MNEMSTIGSLVSLDLQSMANVALKDSTLLTAYFLRRKALPGRPAIVLRSGIATLGLKMSKSFLS